MSFVHHPVFLITLVAAIAPLLAQTRPGSRIPVVVFEVLLGIVIGPHVLGLIRVDDFFETMISMGTAAMLFRAGMEINFREIRGRPLILAGLGWAASITLACGAVAALALIPGFEVPWLVAIALSTTGLGVLLPLLRDAGLLERPFGRLLMAVGTVGEVGPILTIALLMSGHYSTPMQFAFLLAFLGLVGLALVAGLRARPPKFIAFLSRSMHSSSQFPLRLGLLVFSTFYVMASELGLEGALGSLAAGLIVGQASGSAEAEPFRIKIDAICFGFLMPFFFVGTGVKFDPGVLTQSMHTLVLIPTFFLLFLAVRGLPALLFHKDLPENAHAPFALASSVASLGLVVVICNIGMETQHLDVSVGQALVTAALFSIIVFPPLAKTLGLRGHVSEGIDATSAAPPPDSR